MPIRTPVLYPVAGAVIADVEAPADIEVPAEVGRNRVSKLVGVLSIPLTLALVLAEGAEALVLDEELVRIEVVEAALGEVLEMLEATSAGSVEGVAYVVVGLNADAARLPHLPSKLLKQSVRPAWSLAAVLLQLT